MLRFLKEDIFKNVIVNPSVEELRSMSKDMEITTEFGSPCYITNVRNRSAKNSFIVDDVCLGVDQQGIKREKADEIIDKVNKYLLDTELVRIDRKMGMHDKFSFNCRLYITKKYSRIGYMWHNTLFDPVDTENPDLVSVYVPEWPERIIIVYPEEGVTYILGTDYFGESKKSFLRMAMYKVKKMGGIGLHAGSKILRVKDKSNNLKDVGFIMFGLSGTGKTTLTIHDHDLKGEEKAIIRQDDVIFMDENGYCAGTENGFFIKTEGLDESQKVLYKAATSKNSIFENVKVYEDGKVDFNDTQLTSNGRGVVLREEIENTDDSIDLKKANRLIFITRRKDIVPPVAKLTPSQAATFFMLGESIETSAGDPTKAGQSKRCVGTNPFIIGLEAEEGNRIYQILNQNPDMECFILNTGSVGASENFEGEKITIKVSTTIMREIAKDNIEWEVDKDWGYLVPKNIEGIDIEKYNPRKYYSDIEYKNLVNKLKEERKNWILRFETLSEEIASTIE
ncbi:phosphoenolpyruvate carboxykinase (ATP) [Alkalithermobacter thermoalcaliphilus JW-YL-7 = DSM 7308]|uniref:phosphoenolpyruvate carboxykinase (ATP) n=1 Tax=Alkalithermobacter thermoalcaliphilus JW-YL-7 = DSM 7308 TaxID=1121328 RepID=A0A150FRY1_CLOPD|nr:phosphoenolpyruvate carboxykinase (ATP) [[Clostridium] paradoxum JW-YL-7 = DSM 7308]SHK37282.1 phosphoenolpyruvate carboxykinase (ATP) [[Clostridium] paradoxum JW-YL-7 = DSM 7308]